jgi:phosphatidylglycerol:prolipoprotein diacylglycerol transferase
MHPVLVKFGPITIRYYGLMYVIAIALGLLILFREVRRKKIVCGITGQVLALDDLLDLLLWTIPAAIIGARIYYVAFQWQYYSSHLLDVLKIWQGGLAIHGGLIGGIIAVYLFSLAKKISFWALTDAVAPSLILGQAIGRIGNLMNGDAYGTPTQLPWGIHFPADSPAGMAYPGQATHPSMIYEMILNLMIFGLLWKLRKRNYRDGFITALYFILYSIARSIVSFTRGDSLWLGPIRAAHAISAVLVLLFLTLILSRRLYKKTTPETAPPNKNGAQADQ